MKHVNSLLLVGEASEYDEEGLPVGQVPASQNFHLSILTYLEQVSMSGTSTERDQEFIRQTSIYNLHQ